ncbi:hypothetical protein [Bradyrhizobium tropiciagri]|uniref:hypothetical protein n=1 Tax=Bradyrhizobium tropiciagri TaxID=312253 RepID=UPI0020118E1E|nr:hypothetical protein [Bradyrhizobium tropiciagri]
MAHGRNKYQSRENRARVREILLRDWDPIGVYGIPKAANEYDSYADKAYVMLMDDGASANAIALYLFKIATEHMGLTDRGRLAEKSKEVARLLVQLRPEFGIQ